MCNVLITVNHLSDSLKLLFGDEPSASLPVAGKPLLEHVLESVVELNATRVTIAASGDVMGLRHRISNGERWGVPIEVISAKTNEPFCEICARSKKLSTSELVIVPCDRLYITSLAVILNALRKELSSGHAIHCERSGMTLTTPNANLKNISGTNCVDVSVHHIHDARSHHSANVAAANGTAGTLRLSGKQQAIGLVQGYMTRFHPRCVQSGHVYVGNHCRVHSTCKITGPVVINHGVSIDRMTVIENSIIFDNTIIGEHLDVRNSIVFGDTIIRIDNGAVIKLSDEHLVSRRGKGLYAEYGSGPINQLAGGIIFLLTFPILVLILCIQVLRSPTSVLQKRTFIGNKTSKDAFERDAFVTYIIDSPNSRFRYLPMLLDVIMGNIKLFGVSVLTPEEYQSRHDEWQKVTQEFPIGLIGPTQLYVGLNAPLDEKLLSDTLSAHSCMGISGFGELLIRCIKIPFLRKQTI